VEYMVFPRLLALSEVVWSPAARRDWDSFARRLPTSLRILDGYGVNYRIPDVDGLGNDSLTLDDHVTLTLRSLDGGEIHCTTDGREPTPDSPRCDGPLTVPVDERGVTVSARVILPDGRRSTVRHATYRRGRLRPAEDVAAADVVPGLSYRYYEAQVGTTSQLDSLAPVRTGDAPAVALTGGERAERFGLEFAGLIRVPRDGIYAFRLTSDDGSVLTIDGRVVVDHDGLHGPDAKTGMAALAAGFHPIVVRYFQAGGGKALALEWVDAAGDGRPVTPWLFHAR
jgi:hexosaminidase